MGRLGLQLRWLLRRHTIFLILRGDTHPDAQYEGHATSAGGRKTTRNGCLQRQRVALWSIGAAQERHRSAPSCQRQVKRPLALPVKRLYIALNAQVMRLVRTPVELKELVWTNG